MVLLTMTASIVEGLQTQDKIEDTSEVPTQREDKPSLDNPRVGNPISHGQIVDLWRHLKGKGYKDYTLETLLRGTRVYISPPPPKPEPSAEYKALMAHLRREEEARAYERMVNPPPPRETFSQRFPHAATAHAFAEVNRPTTQTDIGDDDVTYSDVHRQLMLVLNFLASILGVAATLWIVARWWSTPARLFLTMGGTIIVGVAEVAVYSGYIWHLTEAKKKDKTLREVKEVVQTWVVGHDNDAEGDKTVAVDGKVESEDTGIRRRKNDPT